MRTLLFIGLLAVEVLSATTSTGQPLPPLGPIDSIPPAPDDPNAPLDILPSLLLPPQRGDSAPSLPQEGGPAILTAGQIDVIKETIGDRLYDPYSAVFSMLGAVTSRTGRLHVCGLVNAKNRFGAFVGRRPFFGVYDPEDKTFAILDIADGDSAVDRVRSFCQQKGLLR
jgi:hypothetical protein